MTKCKVESKRARTESGPNEPLERSSDSESESYSEFDSDEAFTVIRLPAGQTSRDASGVETSSQAADQGKTLQSTLGGDCNTYWVPALLQLVLKRSILKGLH